jgi:hypothetical protein
MQVSIRSYLTAGTALIGAGAIALSPVNPAATAVHELQIPAVTVSSVAVELAAAVNPFQTWVSTVSNAFVNLDTVAQAMWALPAPVLQQVVANVINYAAIDIGAYQAAAAAAVKYYGSTGPNSFQGLMQAAIPQLEAGNISGAVNTLYNATVFNTALVLEQMETALQIPQLIVANLSTTVNYVLGYGIGSGFIAQVGAAILQGTLFPLGAAVGGDLQGAYTSAVGGDWLGTIASLADLPGALTNALLNGAFPNAAAAETGILGSSTLPFGGGVLGIVALLAPSTLASAIVTPGAQNIVAGGSVATALQDLLTQVTTGWPSLAGWASIPVGIVAGLNGLPQAILGAIATAVHGLVGGAAATAASTHTAITPAAAASSVTSAARTVHLSVATSRTALAASTAGSDTTTTGPSTPATVAGAPHSGAHTATPAPSGAGAQVSTATTSTGTQDHQPSVGKQRTAGNTTHPANSAHSGSAK